MLDLLKEHIASLNYGWVSFVFEVLIVIFAIIAISIILVRHVRSKHIFISYLVTLILLLISIIVGTTIGIYITLIAFILLSFMTILYYLPEYKKLFSKKIVRKPSKEFLSDQEVKEELIETLIKAAEHLANRKIGAIITIEKEHTLNTLVEGSVKLDALITFELLETIFHPNTALHDGAVIIRGNRIKCASAFYQPSQKKDIPQHYGSRHRAAIGISEQSDAFTIVVSEETGHIATTIGGTITGNVSLESLKTSLDQQLIVR